MRSDAKVYKVIAEVLGGWRLQCDDSGEYVEKPGASLAVFPGMGGGPGFSFSCAGL